MSLGTLGRWTPVEPDADTARRWAREELADPTYHRGKTLLERFLEWLRATFEDLLRGAEGQSVDPRTVGLVILAVVLVVGLVAWWVAGPVRLARRAAQDRIVFDADDVRTAAQMRGAAAASASRGDWHAAVLDQFRALVRGLEERALLEERAGRTAHEVALDAATVLPSLSGPLLSASSLFDEVCYGEGEGSAEGYASLVTLDEQVRATSPQPRAEVEV